MHDRAFGIRPAQPPGSTEAHPRRAVHKVQHRQPLEKWQLFLNLHLAAGCMPV